MTDQWTHRLSEYLDDELSAAERRQMDEHLGTCGACQETLAQLRAGVARAASLEDSGPERDLWPGGAGRGGGGGWGGGGGGRGGPQLAAAAVALLAGAAGWGWPAEPRGRRMRQG